MRWAGAHGRRAAFIDIPTGTSLASHDREHVDIDDAGAEEDAAGAVPEASMSDLAPSGPASDPSRSSGRPHSRRRRTTSTAFAARLLAYADLVRSDDRNTFHRARDAFMAREIEALMASGVPSDKVAVVLGAAHAAAFVAGDVDRSLEATLPPPVQSRSR